MTDERKNAPCPPAPLPPSLGDFNEYRLEVSELARRACDQLIDALTSLLHVAPPSLPADQRASRGREEGCAFQLPHGKRGESK